MIVRRLLGTMAGIIVAGLTIAAVEAGGHALVAPAGPSDPASATVTTLALVVVAWGLGALFGGLVAAAITRWPVAPYVVAGFVALGILVNAATFPQPLWMTAAGVALVWLAARFSAGRARGSVAPA